MIEKIMTKNKIFSTKKFGDLITVTGKYLLENRDKILLSGSPCCSSGDVLYDTSTGELKVSKENPL